MGIRKVYITKTAVNAVDVARTCMIGWRSSLITSIKMAVTSVQTHLAIVAENVEWNPITLIPSSTDSEKTEETVEKGTL